jgi:hypothetical protein
MRAVEAGGEHGRIGRLDSLYARLGPRYPLVALGASLHLQLVIFAFGVGVLALFVPMALGELAVVVAAALVGQAAWYLGARRRIAGRVRPLVAWIGGDRSERSSAEAWRVSVALPLEFVRFQWRSPIPLVALPAWCAFTIWELGLPAYAFPVLLFVSLCAVVYGLSV